MSTWALLIAVFARFGMLAAIVTAVSVPLAVAVDKMMGGEN